MAKTTTAHKAAAELALRGMAVKVSEFSRCKVYDFADGSFLTVWDNGRTEVNAVNA